MLAYQQISQHFGSPQSNESRLKRSLSPGEMTYRHKESIDYVRSIRRRSLSRSASPARSHSPTYMSHMKTAELHLIKRSVSEEDLRVSHERRRLSMEESERHAISHRPQILMNYRGLKVEEECDEKPQFEAADEPDDDAPLDLSMGSKKRRGRTDSGTDSDDSTGLGDGRGHGGRAYKKNLMKRYCKSNLFYLFCGTESPQRSSSLTQFS
jgi:hypothetical protein